LSLIHATLNIAKKVGVAAAAKMASKLQFTSSLASCQGCCCGHMMPWQGIAAAGAMGWTAQQHGA